MGVKIRERMLTGGEVAIYIDTYHRDFGRFSQKTGLQVDPKNRKEYRQILQEAQDRVRKLEKDLQRDPAGVFGRKEIAADNFIDFCRQYPSKDKYSKYSSVIPMLQKFSGDALQFSALNSVWLEKFKTYLLSIEHLSQNTAAGYLVAVKSIIKKAYREGLITEDFTLKVSGIKRIDAERHFLTVEHIERLNSVKCNNEMIKNAFLFACFTGLRLADIEALTWEKISLINGKPYVQFRQRKTLKYENMPLSEQSQKILSETRELHARYAPADNKKVFILPSRVRLGIILDNWGIRAGLPFKLHFHISRHTFATLSITSGADLYTVSKLLGHSEIKTTQIYAQIIDQKKIDAVQSLPVISSPEKFYKTLVTDSSMNEDKLLAIVESDPDVSKKQHSVSRALELEGERVAKVLKLHKNEQGLFSFEGRKYTAIELALEISGD